MKKSEIASGPTYHIRVFRTGTCRVKGPYAYGTYARDRDHAFTLYISVIQGHGITALVDVGMASVAEMNRQVAFLLSEPITQGEDETLSAILSRAGITTEDVNVVFLTHCHYDHGSNLPLFPNATAVIPAHAWEVWHTQPDGAVYLHPGFLKHLETLEAEGRLHLAGADNSLDIIHPGLGVRWVGGHSPCSQFIYVNTDRGVVAFTGDTVQMYGNLAHDDIVAICGDKAQCRRALEIARESADILVPGHDPAILERFPDGIVA
jgi:glyoxylase-like metal-dependent hydrolase (beta-lactamase superfamily II)